MGLNCVSGVATGQKLLGKRSGFLSSLEYVRYPRRCLKFTFLTPLEVLLDRFHERHIGGRIQNHQHIPDSCVFLPSSTSCLRIADFLSRRSIQERHSYTSRTP